MQATAHEPLVVNAGHDGDDGERPARETQRASSKAWPRPPSTKLGSLPGRLRARPAGRR